MQDRLRHISANDTENLMAAYQNALSVLESAKEDLKNTLVDRRRSIS